MRTSVHPSPFSSTDTRSPVAMDEMILRSGPGPVRTFKVTSPRTHSAWAGVIVTWVAVHRSPRIVTDRMAFRVLIPRVRRARAPFIGDRVPWSLYPERVENRTFQPYRLFDCDRALSWL